MAELNPLDGYSIGFQIGMVVLAAVGIACIILGNVMFGANDITMGQILVMVMMGVLGGGNILLL